MNGRNSPERVKLVKTTKDVIQRYIFLSWQGEQCEDKNVRTHRQKETGVAPRSSAPWTPRIGLCCRESPWTAASPKSDNTFLSMIRVLCFTIRNSQSVLPTDSDESLSRLCSCRNKGLTITQDSQHSIASDSDDSQSDNDWSHTESLFIHNLKWKDVKWPDRCGENVWTVILKLARLASLDQINVGLPGRLFGSDNKDSRNESSPDENGIERVFHHASKCHLLRTSAWHQRDGKVTLSAFCCETDRTSCGISRRQPLHEESQIPSTHD